MIERIEAWLRVRDSQRYTRDMRDAAKATRGVGSAARSAGAASMWAGQQGHRARSGFMAMGTGARWAAFGLGIAAAGALKMGIEFNATMEQNEIALDAFTGSSAETNKMLESLFETAAKTPFEFRDVTTAARKFLAFGFTVKDTESHLRTIGDTVAGIGGGFDEINRAVIAFGQMQAKGRIMGQELLQLTELGIPAYRILREEFNLTSKEMNRIGDQGISAKEGIAALMKGMDETFGGLAQRQAKSLAGQWSTFKDYFRQTMGALTRPLFEILRKTVLPALTKFMPVLQREAPKLMSGLWAGLTGGLAPGGKMGRIGQDIGEWLKNAFAVVKDVVGQLITALKPAMPFLENVVIPIIKGIAIAIGITLVGLFKLAIPVITIIAKILGWLGEQAEPIEGIMEGVGIAIGLIFGGPILAAVKIGGKLGMMLQFTGKIIVGFGAVTAKVFGFLFGIFAKFIGIFGKVIGFAAKGIAWWVKIHILAWKTVFSLWGKVVNFMMGLVSKIFQTALKIGRGIWSGLKAGISGLVGVIRTVMNDALGFLASLPSKFWNAGVKIAKALIRGIKSLFAAGLGFAVDMGKTIANAVINLLNDAIPNSLPVPHAPDIPLPDNPIPTFHRGGMMKQGGWALVGRAGAEEAAWLPAGAEVYPHSSLVTRAALKGSKTGSGSLGPLVDPLGDGGFESVHSYLGMTEGKEPGGKAEGKRPQVIQLVVGRRVLAEVVAEEMADRRARR